jgi:Holliday junction resolvasome RuvABC endonuclease subunit
MRQTSRRRPASGSSTDVVRTAGLDLSLTGTGFVICENLEPVYVRLLQTDTVKAAPKAIRAAGGGWNERRNVFHGELEARIEFIAKRVAVGLRQHRPLLVTIEGYSFGSVGGMLRDRCELTGTVKNRIHRLGIDISKPVAPKSLKKYATGSGDAGKDSMIAAAQERGFVTLDDNIADAYFLADWAYSMGLGNLPAS